MQEQFDIDRIIGIKVVPRCKTSYRWMPPKRKTLFFGLIKRDAWHKEGFYENGCYYEGSSSGDVYDSTPYTLDDLKRRGYIADERKRIEETEIYRRPYVTVYLESDYQTTKVFESENLANEWVEELKAKSRKTFEIVKNL